MNAASVARRRLLHGLAGSALGLAALPAVGAESSAVASRRAAVDRLLAGLRGLGISADDCSVAVEAVAGQHPSARVLDAVWHRPDASMNPASCVKVYTAWGAAVGLGLGHRFTTEIWGRDRSQPLDRQPLLVRGGGDPKLLVEDLEAWRDEILAARGPGAHGAARLGTAIAFDGRRYRVPPESPADFDRSPEKPYNVLPHACLMNFQSAALVRTGQGLGYLPPLPGVPLQDRVQWEPGCESRPSHSFSIVRLPGDAGLRVTGRWSAGCLEGDGRSTPLAYASPLTETESFNHRLLDGLWQARADGRGPGRAGDGIGPLRSVEELAAVCRQPLLRWRSGRSLTELLGDVLARSSNIISRHLFLELDADPGPNPQSPGRPATLAGAENRLHQLLRTAQIPHEQLRADNGAGLSRISRVSARELNALLRSPPPSMPWEEWRDAFAVWGETGSARRAPSIPGRVIRVKTGSLRDVRSLCGYIHPPSGRLVVFTLIVNHAKSSEARPHFWRFVQDLAAEDLAV